MKENIKKHNRTFQKLSISLFVNFFKGYIGVALILILRLNTICAQSVALDADINPGGVIMEMPLQLSSISGSTYIEDEWLSGKIELVNGKVIPELLMKFDAQNNILEIKYESEIRACSLDKLKSFEWKLIEESKNIQFVNSFYYDIFSQKNPNTLLELINAGEHMNLFKQYVIEIKEPTYVEEFNTGSRISEILMKNKYYLHSENQFYKLSTTLKKNREFFKSKYDEIESYAKKYKLKFKNEEDLIQLLKFYETLL